MDSDTDQWDTSPAKSLDRERLLSSDLSLHCVVVRSADSLTRVPAYGAVSHDWKDVSRVSGGLRCPARAWRTPGRSVVPR